MCGRFTLRTRGEELAEHFELADAPLVKPRFNIAPGQDVLAVRCAEGGRQAEFRRWGLVPPWAEDPRIGSRMINARSETVVVRRAFAEAARRRRCLIPADGFYEWGAHQGQRVPFHITRTGSAVFAMAGLFERWHGEGGEVVDSCTILTREARGPLLDLHDRMPLILDPADYAQWLDPEDTGADTFLASLDVDPELHLKPVSTRLNQVAFDDPACLDPPEEPAQGTLF